MTKPNVNHLAVLKIAVPIMLANVTEPLIGVVNTGVVGQLPNPALIGGVAVGGLIFAFLFWGFGFLRLSTSGISAQATGAQDHEALAMAIGRSLFLGLAIGVVLLMASPAIGPLAIHMMGGSTEVQAAAHDYFRWRIFSAPAALANFAILGWFVGQGRSVVAFVVQILLNVTNMAFSVFLVLQLHWGVAGVGIAAVIAEYLALGVGLLLVVARLSKLGQGMSFEALFERAAFRKLIGTNVDIMIRTVCLLAAYAWFISRGAKNGDIVVAANAVLLNFFDVAAYFIDGFAYAAEALVGQSIGAQDQKRFSTSISLAAVWALGVGVFTSLVTWFGGPAFISLMSVDPDVRTTAMIFLPWAALMPFLGTISFLFDGIFTGALATRDMRNLMVLSLIVFFACAFVLEQQFGNHGLWAALSIFLVVRSITFAMRLPAIKKRVFAQID